MIKKSTLKEVIRIQRERKELYDLGQNRALLEELLPIIKDYALIISGIRRCGKSTLLYQLINRLNEDCFFLNFDVAKLYTFTIEDFELLDEVITESQCKILFFDELQIVEGWEVYVRQKLDEGFKVVVTGSNASLLSKELGTRLTGRHLTKELFPFSFLEFCSFLNFNPNEKESFLKYMEKGGFPAFLKTNNLELHTLLLEDIINRDVAVRHNIRDVQALKHLLVFLASNSGNLISATKIKNIISVKSTATVSEYLSHFEQSYLIQLIPKFAYSQKVQLVNPRKVYFIDTGLQRALTPSFTKDSGRKLETIVFWEFRRLKKQLYYFNENGMECDFVVCHNNKVEQVVQVCYKMNRENEKREINGLLDAMRFFDLKEGLILTFDQEDKIKYEDKRILVVPVYNYFGL